MEYQSCSESISENFMHGNMVSNVYACELDHLEISKKVFEKRLKIIFKNFINLFFSFILLFVTG